MIFHESQINLKILKKLNLLILKERIIYYGYTKKSKIFLGQPIVYNYQLSYILRLFKNFRSSLSCEDFPEASGPSKEIKTPLLFI